MVSEPRRDRAEEREEVGRIPAGPGRGWRLRAKKAKSCEVCEGDLWVEGEGGEMSPCSCRERRAARRAHNHLRAGEWWKGTSLSFAAPPLASVSLGVRGAVEGLCAEVKAERNPKGIWLVGMSGTGKSALCAYIAQRLYPSNHAIAQQVGDLLGHLRWLGAVKGEQAVEHRLEKLIETPVLVLDNVDRAIRSRPSSAPFALDASCLSHDLVRFSRLLQERHAAMKPTVMTSRAEPADCPARLASVTRKDLVRGLLGTVAEASDPFEDFPDYTAAVLKGSMEAVCNDGERWSLDLPQAVAKAA